MDAKKTTSTTLFPQTQPFVPSPSFALNIGAYLRLVTSTASTPGSVKIANAGTATTSDFFSFYDNRTSRDWLDRFELSGNSPTGELSASVAARTIGVLELLSRLPRMSRADFLQAFATPSQEFEAANHELMAAVRNGELPAEIVAASKMIDQSATTFSAAISLPQFKAIPGGVFYVAIPTAADKTSSTSFSSKMNAADESDLNVATQSAATGQSLTTTFIDKTGSEKTMTVGLFFPRFGLLVRRTGKDEVSHELALTATELYVPSKNVTSYQFAEVAAEKKASSNSTAIDLHGDLPIGEKLMVTVGYHHSTEHGDRFTVREVTSRASYVRDHNTGSSAQHRLGPGNGQSPPSQEAIRESRSGVTVLFKGQHQFGTAAQSLQLTTGAVDYLVRARDMRSIELDDDTGNEKSFPLPTNGLQIGLTQEERFAIVSLAPDGVQGLPDDTRLALLSNAVGYWIELPASGVTLSTNKSTLTISGSGQSVNLAGYSVESSDGSVRIARKRNQSPAVSAEASAELMTALKPIATRETYRLDASCVPDDKRERLVILTNGESKSEVIIPQGVASYSSHQLYFKDAGVVPKELNNNRALSAPSVLTDLIGTAGLKNSTPIGYAGLTKPLKTDSNLRLTGSAQLALPPIRKDDRQVVGDKMQYAMKAGLSNSTAFLQNEWDIISNPYLNPLGAPSLALQSAMTPVGEVSDYFRRFSWSIQAGLTSSADPVTGQSKLNPFLYAEAALSDHGILGYGSATLSAEKIDFTVTSNLKAVNLGVGGSFGNNNSALTFKLEADPGKLVNKIFGK